MPVSAPKRPRLLVVDDDPGIAEALAHLLAQRYLVDTAGNGVQAMACLESTHYDLLLLDLVMPYMDGRGVVRELRQRRSEVPIVLMSGSADLVERAVELRVDAYLPKPLDPGLLQDRITALLDRRAA